MPVRQPLRLAHRGDHRRHPENSLAAILAAVAIPGCDGIEFDLRQSRDGVPVLSHDPSLERVYGRPDVVARCTAAELEAFGIAPLADVLAALPHRVFLDIELKESFDRRIVEILAAGRGPELRNAAISSFDVPTLRRMRELVPVWPRWLNAHQLTARTISTAVELECAALSVDWRAIEPRQLAAARAEGLAVAAWTVTRRPTYARLARLGVAAICVEGPALIG